MPRKSKTKTSRKKKVKTSKKEEVLEVKPVEVVETTVVAAAPKKLSSPSMWASHQVHQHATSLLSQMYKFNESKLTELMTNVYGETDQDVIDSNVERVLGPKPIRIKKVKDPNKPKKPPTGYQLFCKEYNNNPSENKPTTLIELSKLQSKMWRDLSKEDKDKYLEHAAAKKDLYKKAMEIYNQRSAPVIKKVVVRI